MDRRMIRATSSAPVVIVSHSSSSAEPLSASSQLTHRPKISEQEAHHRAENALQNHSFNDIVEKLARVHCCCQDAEIADYAAVTAAFFMCYTRFYSTNYLLTYIAKAVAIATTAKSETYLIGYLRLIMHWVETRFKDDFVQWKRIEKVLSIAGNCTPRSNSDGAASPKESPSSKKGHTRHRDGTASGALRVPEHVTAPKTITVKRYCLSDTAVCILNLLDGLLNKSTRRNGSMMYLTCQQQQLLHEQVYRIKLAFLKKYSHNKQVYAESVREVQVSSIPGLALKSKVTFFDFPPAVIAEQLTLLEHSIFRSIPMEEFRDKNWSHRERAPALFLLISRADQISYWVASCLLCQKTPIARANTAIRFITIAYWCRELNNYNGMNSVIGGFNLWCIDRLKRQNALNLEPKFVLLLVGMQRIMSHTNNFAAYRRVLADLYKNISRERPALPYVGTFTHDLTFIEDGNNDLTEGSTSVIEDGKKKPNIPKISMLGETLSKISRFQSVDYSKRIKGHIPQLLRYLAECPRMSLAELEQRTLELKPAKQGVSIRDEPILPDADLSHSSTEGGSSITDESGSSTLATSLVPSLADISPDNTSIGSADEMVAFSNQPEQSAALRVAEVLKYIPAAANHKRTKK